MSERAAMAGDRGPPHTIRHGDKTYEVRPVVTEGVMLAVEAELYERAKHALVSQRDMMSEPAYLERLDKLREKYEKGGFSFEHPDTMAALKTQKGAITLLCCMMDCTAAEVLTLMTERTADMKDILETVLKLSFPSPKQGAPRRKRQRPGR